MADTNRPKPKGVESSQPDVIATPEGDGEFDPAEPLRPLPEDALEDPRGNPPSRYSRDQK